MTTLVGQAGTLRYLTRTWKKPQIRCFSSEQPSRRTRTVDEHAQSLLSAPKSIVPNVFSRMAATLKIRFGKDKTDPMLKALLDRASAQLYYDCANRFDYDKLCESFGMKDYMSSWFKLTLLHNWMVLLRLHVSLDADAYLRLQRGLLATMWLDVDKRLEIVGKELGQSMLGKTDMSHMHGLHLQSFLEYDEGILSNDTVLAAAVWRNMYMQRECDPVHVLRVVTYIREKPDNQTPTVFFIPVRELMTMAQETIETNSFLFKSLQKIRLIDPNTVQCSSSSGRWLAVSSQLQIGVAVQGGSSFVCFSTADVQKRTTNRQNVNAVVTDLQKKTVSIHVVGASVHTIGVNSDGNWLAALVDTPSGPFVYIYDAKAFSLSYGGEVFPTHEVRICAEPNANARAFDWNPAVPEVFAASASDNSLIVVKVDFSRNAAYTMVGEKRLGAAVGVISWSPKGKQLTVGDDLGKITQLKPELEIVRSTMPQTQLASPKTVGLFWLATTEWIVAYGSHSGPGIDSGILTIKKDKPPTLRRLGDLSYESRTADRPSSVYGLSFGEWNVVTLASARSPDVMLVGKEKDDWQVWQVDESYRFDLPLCEGKPGQASYPIGLSIDRSYQQDVLISDDGQLRRPAMPIVMVLTTDGILASCFAVTSHPQHTSIQVKPVPVSATSVKIGPKPVGSLTETSASVPAPQAVAAAPSQQSAAPSTPSLFGGSARPAVGSLFGGLTASPAATSKPPLTATTSLFGSQAPATVVAVPAAAPAADNEAAKVVEQQKAREEESRKKKEQEELEKKRREEEERRKKDEIERLKREQAEKERKAHEQAQAQAAAIVGKRLKLQEKLTLINNEFAMLRIDQERLSAALTEVKKMPVEDPVPKYIREVIPEMNRMASELAGDQQLTMYLLKQLSRRVAEGSEVVGESTDAAEALAELRLRDSFDREQRMKQLEERLIDAKTKLAETKRTFNTIKKTNVERSPLIEWSHVDVQTESAMSELLSKITSLSQNIRAKEDKLERDVGFLESSLKSSKLHGKKGVDLKPVVAEHSVTMPVGVKAVPEKDLNVARERLKLICEARSRTVRRTPAILSSNLTVNAEPSKPKSDLARVQELLEESLRQTMISDETPLKKNVLKFSVSTQSPDPRESKAAVKTEKAPVISISTSASKPTAASAFPPTTTSMFAPKMTSTPMREGITEIPEELLSGDAVTGGNQTAGIFGASLTASAKTKPVSPLALGGKSVNTTSGTSTTSTLSSLLKSDAKTEDVAVKKDDQSKAKSQTSSIFGGLATSSTSAVATSTEAKPSFSFGGLLKTTSTPAPDATGTLQSMTTAPKSPLLSQPATGESKTEVTVSEETKKDEKKEGTLQEKVEQNKEAEPAPAAPVTTAVATPEKKESKPLFNFAATPPSSIPVVSTCADTKSTFGFGTPIATTSAPTAAQAKPADFSFKAAASSAAAGEPAKTTSIFGGANTGSIFASAADKPSTEAKTGSIFGQASSGQSSLFGGQKSIFGQTSGGSSVFGGGAATPQTAGTATGGSSVAFSFKKPDAQPAAAATPAFSFKGQAGGFAAAAAAAAAQPLSNDDGMMEDAAPAAPQQQASTGSIFGGGGGFMGGLGSSASQSNAGKNVFGSGLNLGGSSQSTGASTGWLFGKGGNQQQQPKQQTGSIFGGGGAAAPQQQQQTGSVFGGAPKFGAAPAFGSSPAFGAKPAFGSAAAPTGVTAFGGAASQGTGFSAFAGKGTGFGALAQQGQQSSVFGGAQPASFGSKTSGSFSSWR